MPEYDYDSPMYGKPERVVFPYKLKGDNYQINPVDPAFLGDVTKKIAQAQRQMEDEAIREQVIQVLRSQGYTVTPPRWADRWVDPPDCGCTDCLTGYSTPALDYDEYEAVGRSGRSR